MGVAFQNCPPQEQVIRLSGLAGLICRHSSWQHLGQHDPQEPPRFPVLGTCCLGETPWLPYLLPQTPKCFLCNIYDTWWFSVCVCFLGTVSLQHHTHTHTHTHTQIVWLTHYCHHLDLCLTRSNCSVNIWEWMKSRNKLSEKLLGKSVKQPNLPKIFPVEEGGILG